MPYAVVNGQRLHYQDSGGAGPALIFSHGLLMDLAMFAPQVAALRDRYRCIACDERGHGGTAVSSLAPFSYYDSADDLAAPLTDLGIRQVEAIPGARFELIAGAGHAANLTHPELATPLIERFLAELP